MTITETVDIIKESSLWQTLNIGEKIDALLYAVENIDGARQNINEQLDVSDIIGEVFMAL